MGVPPPPREQIINTTCEKNTLTRKRKKKSKFADTDFSKNYPIVSWPNFSQIGSRVADLEFKTYPRLALIFISRKQWKKSFGGVLPVTRCITDYNTKAANVDAYQGSDNNSDTAGKG